MPPSLAAHFYAAHIELLGDNYALGQADDPNAEANAELAALLEHHEFGLHRYVRVRHDSILKVANALKNWSIIAEKELPGFAASQSVPAPRGDRTAFTWAEEQQARGRGILLRGNPFALRTGNELYVYATRYIDLAMSDPNMQPYVLAMPMLNGGWYLAALKEHPDDPVSPGASTIAPKTRNVAAAGAVVVAVALAVVFLQRGQNGSH
jgi:hypothetical protein